MVLPWGAEATRASGRASGAQGEESIRAVRRCSTGHDFINDGVGRDERGIPLVAKWAQPICLRKKASWGRWAGRTIHFSSVQLLSRVPLFATSWTAARQASLFITSSRSPPKHMSIESEMPSNHLILCRPLFLLPLIFPSIRVFSHESALRIRWPKCWSFSFNISPSNEHPGMISFRMDRLDLLAVQGTLKSLLQHHSSKHQFFCAQLSSQSNSHIYTWSLEKP